MGTQRSYTHPNNLIYKLQQLACIALLLFALFAAAMLVIVAFVLAAPLFVVVSLLLLLISAPVLMALVNTPPITIHDDGFILEPFIGGKRHIGWDEIERIEAYPLLPQANQEILKQYLVGRNKYRAAEGIMLIIPSLPLPYRIAGLLAGEKAAPLIAFTNRSHSDYELLIQAISHHATNAIQNHLTNEE